MTPAASEGVYASAFFAGVTAGALLAIRSTLVGFEDGEALALATDPTVDLHQATDLLRHGCPRETALNILL